MSLGKKIMDGIDKRQLSRTREMRKLCSGDREKKVYDNMKKIK